MALTPQEMIQHQLKQFFGLSEKEAKVIVTLVPRAEKRCHHCFTHIKNKYYVSSPNKINPLHSSQYATFLYYLSREVASMNNQTELADKIYYLNKSLNNCELYHAVELPDIMYFDHPLGSIMGRANYSNYFSFQQGCCVGNNHDTYPTIGEYVHMFANSTIIGNSTIGSRVFVSANTYIKDQNIPDNSIVFGSSPDLKIVAKPNSYFDERSPFILDDA